MKKRLLLKVTTVAAKHVNQLPFIHEWEGKYPWEEKNILGRMASNGFILVQDKKTGQLDLVGVPSFDSWRLFVLGCIIDRAGEPRNWKYAPTPHTAYSQQARADYSSLPQLFVD